MDQNEPQKHLILMNTHSLQYTVLHTDIHYKEKYLKMHVSICLVNTYAAYILHYT